jgi:catalase
MNSYRAFGKKDMTEYHKQYAKENADKIKEYQSQYHIENADKLKEQKEQYYLDNKERWEKYTEKRKEKITCECGCVVSKGRFTTHLKSPKHAKLMETKIASPNI